MTRLSYPIAALAILALAYLGVAQTLGAHPIWSTQIAWIGAPIGLVAAFALHRAPKPLRIGFFAALLIAAALAAYFGKQQFAASFAEDRLAGKFWYYGWIGSAASATALVAALLTAAATDATHDSRQR